MINKATKKIYKSVKNKMKIKMYKKIKIKNMKFL